MTTRANLARNLVRKEKEREEYFVDKHVLFQLNIMYLFK